MKYLITLMLLLSFSSYSQRAKLYSGLPKESYYRNGGLRQQRNYIEGELKNISTYYKSGALKSFYIFNAKGQHDSIANFYFPNGKVKTTWIYKKGVVRKRTDFNNEGNIIKGKKKYDKIRECNNNLMRDRNNLNWIFRRAKTNSSLGYYDEAIEDYMFLISEKNPKSVTWRAQRSFYHSIAIAYDAIEDYENSLKYNFQAYSFDHDNQAVLNNIGFLLFHAKDYDLSMEYLNKCHKINPNNYYAFFNKSLIYLEKGNLVKAKEFIDRTLADERSQKHLARGFNHERNLWTTSGEIYHKLGNNALAINYLNKAIANNTVNSYAYKCLGDVYMSMNIPNQACLYYSIALKYKYDIVHDSMEFKNRISNNCSFYD